MVSFGSEFVICTGVGFTSITFNFSAINPNPNPNPTATEARIKFVYLHQTKHKFNDK